MTRRYNKPSQTASCPSEISAPSYVNSHVATGSVTNHNVPAQTRTKQMVNAGIRTQLKPSMAVPLEQWLRSYLGVRYDHFLQCARNIEAQQWFLKAKVQAQLRKFCEAPREEDRYDPLVALGIDILARARKDLEGVKYSVPNITFSNTSSSTIVDFAAPKDAVAARRRPDVVVAPKLSKTEITRRVKEEQQEKEKRAKGKRCEEDKRKEEATTKKTRATRGKEGKAAPGATAPEVKDCRRYWHEILQLWELKKHSDKLRINLEGATKKAEAQARTIQVRKVTFFPTFTYECNILLPLSHRHRRGTSRDSRAHVRLLAIARALPPRRESCPRSRRAPTA